MGFHGGETSQWYPTLFRNTTLIDPPASPEQGYHLTSDLVDEAIRWISIERAQAPARPYFLYFSPGAMHRPHHAPKAWIERFKGRFDKGWDAIREEIFVLQKKLGVIPPDAVLTPRPAELPPLTSMSANQRRLLVRQMEVYAGFLAHTDHETGRLLEEIKAQCRNRTARLHFHSSLKETVMRQFDLVIRNGTLVDGSGGAPFQADIAIRDGRIAEIGAITGTATEEIDATGKFVTPGFVDVHTHYDGQITWENRLRPSSGPWGHYGGHGQLRGRLRTGAPD